MASLQKKYPTLDEQFHKNVQYFEHNKGYVLWKDRDSVFMRGTALILELVGAKTRSELEGFTDQDLKCDAAMYADAFIQQDQDVIENDKSILCFDSFLYANDQFYISMGIKAPLKDEHNKIVGVSCTSYSLEDSFLTKVILKILKSQENFRPVGTCSLELVDCFHEFNLSKRESECLYYLMRGKSAKEIGSILGISGRTVESYNECIKNKMGCDSKSDIIDLAIDSGLLTFIPKELFIKLVNGKKSA